METLICIYAISRTYHRDPLPIIKVQLNSTVNALLVIFSTKSYHPFLIMETYDCNQNPFVGICSTMEHRGISLLYFSMGPKKGLLISYSKEDSVKRQISAGSRESNWKYVFVFFLLWVTFCSNFLSTYSICSTLVFSIPSSTTIKNVKRAWESLLKAWACAPCSTILFIVPNDSCKLCALNQWLPKWSSLQKNGTQTTPWSWINPSWLSLS